MPGPISIAHAVTKLPAQDLERARAAAQGVVVAGGLFGRVDERWCRSGRT